MTFPDPADWVAITRGGTALGDVNGDGANQGREIIGNNAFPAAYVSLDGDNLFIRIRVDADPSNGGSPPTLNQFGWGMLFDTDNNTSDYEYSLIVSGSGSPDEIVFGENTTPSGASDPTDDAVEIQTWPVDTDVDGTVLVEVADSCFGQVGADDPTCNDATDQDYFISFGVPWSVLSSDPDLTGAGLTPSTPLRILAGTSTSPNYLDLDLAGFEGSGPNDGTIADTISDPMYLDGSSADGDGDDLWDDADLDDDNDGIPDAAENTIGVDPNADADADGIPNWRDTDDEGDGSGSCADADTNGICDAPTARFDDDGDGVPNHLDLDSDNDSIADVVEAGHGGTDGNGDGALDGPFGTNGLADEVETAADSGAMNYVLLDTDDDGTEDAYDLDSDGDTVFDVDEAGAGVTDGNNDGVVDGADGVDNDGILDAVDGNSVVWGFPMVNVTTVDTDADGIPDAYDFDDDGPGAGDSDSDGSDDDVECAGGWPCPDGDADGTPDYMQGGAAPTCGDGTLDADEGCDHGGTPDANCNASCEIPNGAACNDDTDGLTGNDSCASGFCDTSGGAPGVCTEVPADCGDGDLDPGEGCDHGGSPDANCNSACLIPDGGACNEDGAGATGDDSCVSGFCDTSGGAPGVCSAVDEETDTDDDGVPDVDDLDDDNDGITDAIEGDGDTDGDGVPDRLDLDSDGDGILDVVEAGHGRTGGNGTVACQGGVGMNGLCDRLETEDDSGVLDYNNDGGEDLPDDSDGDGDFDFQDADSDGDGIPDSVESGFDCEDSDDDDICDGGDSDGDGIVNGLDTTDGHGSTHERPENSDGTGEPDYLDLDSDDDTIPDEVEGDVDTDGDGVADFRDLDSDDDSISDEEEGDVDTDEDGDPDFRDTDSDNDQVGDGTDNCRLMANTAQLDIDGDGLGAVCDPDDNGDGFDDRLGIQGGGCQAGGGGAGGLAALLILTLFALMRSRRRLLPHLAALAALLAASSATAQELQTEYPVERFRLSSDGGGILDLEYPSVIPHLAFEAGFWVGYADDPLNVFDAEDGSRDRVASLVSERLSGTVLAAFGISNRFQLGISIPMIFNQEESTDGFMTGRMGLSGSGFGDLGFVPKVHAVRQADQGFDLGLALRVTAPTAGGDDFLGESSWTASPELLMGRDFGKGVRFGVDVGYRFRERQEVLNLIVDDELYFLFGGEFNMKGVGGPPLDFGVTYSMATGADDFGGDFNRNYSEIKGGIGYTFVDRIKLFAGTGFGTSEGFGTPDWRALGGLRIRPATGEAPEAIVTEEEVTAEPVDSDGDGLTDNLDACPLDPETLNGIEDGDGCPDEVPDSDGDGLNDNDDRCPSEAEDMDSFEDDDGCPELDNDKDGVADSADACVNEAGPAANKGCPDPDRDGDTVVDRLDNCPDEAGKPELQGCNEKQLVVIKDNKLEILDVVYFRTGRARIQRRSFALLNNIASVIKSHPEITKIEIEGHTDNVGSDTANKLLSQNRAQAVVNYLVEQGVDKSRLDPKGYGEEKPIADNETKEGRQQNRRVEFTITATAGTPAPASEGGTEPAAPPEGEADGGGNEGADGDTDAQ